MLTTDIRIKDKISASDFLKIEAFDVSKRYTKPHKHNKYLELVYFTEGSGFHYLDTEPYEIQPPVAFLIHQNQIHHWNIDTIPKGYVVIIKEPFLETVLDPTIAILLHQLIDFNAITLQQDAIIDALFTVLTLEMKQSKPDNNVIEGGLKALFSKLLSYTNHSSKPSFNTIEAAFLKLLSETLKNNVSFYAETLHTSAQNLNAICQKVYQKSASDIIADHLIKEIKRQLLYTSKNISAIAYDLEFKDTSNFTKFFKRHTGITPLQFRKQELVI
ncbi:helix-turn-helix domain-containing protein [Aestuariibaculum suncheonense]|uniref:Helix-turn-helix domain-containing protein n=1 Tax=Aestuariibaculum suncheonense TaxID=1028745 RepID=A0A8J6UB30_9FLAO|nr:helix-turn-helix domain-containing protein [Aestuariibaculum suncheonense]MBD0835052.1 helix-turn-helix domain-containing protein [Aestuariibaculum suncheonense]